MNDTGFFKGLFKALIIFGILFAIFYMVSYNKELEGSFDGVDFSYREEGLENHNNKTDKTDNSYIKKYNSLYNMVSYDLIQSYYGDYFFDIYYSDKSFNDDYYIYVSIINLLENDKEDKCNINKVYDASFVAINISKIFGDVDYVDHSLNIKNSLISIDYDSDMNSYIVKTKGDCSLRNERIVKTYYYDSLLEDNYLYIYEKASYLENVVDTSGNTLVTYHSGPESDSPFITMEDDKINLELVQTYVYTYQVIEDNYYLISIGKLK